MIEHVCIRERERERERERDVVDPDSVTNIKICLECLNISCLLCNTSRLRIMWVGEHV